jgi:release factor glutamine methyltransferase
MRERIDALRARLRTRIDRRDVDVLLADVTGRPPGWLFAHGDEVVDCDAIEPLIARRERGEPLQYIRGRADFYGREFYVDDRVLIPRSETELLVEATIARAPRDARLLEVGSGSGCIAVSLACERRDLHVTSIDVSVAALAVATGNARTHAARVTFAASDALDAIRGTFDVVVSNPPYIRAADVETLATEVRDHEPRNALTPGPRGTEIIQRILAARAAPLVMLEIGFGQLADVRSVAGAYDIVGVMKDLAGIERIVTLAQR